jgi:guanylate kinase
MNDKLADKTLVMLIGPSAIGKSTLMNEVIRQNSDFGRVGGFTTRDPRPNDEPGQYRYLDKPEVEHKIAEHTLVQYAIFPTTGQIYGTEIEDYPAKYNLKDILANAVDDFRALPFERIVTISLTAPNEQWQKWFMDRYPAPSDEANKRLGEATLSIDWSLRDPETYWLENSTGNIQNAARELIDIVLQQPPITQSPHPRAMLEQIERGIWHNE